MLVVDFYFLRIFAVARANATRTSVFEITVIREVYRIRHLTGDRIKRLVGVRRNERFTLLKSHSIRVQRIFEYFFRASSFDYLARVHNDYFVRHFGYNAEVVGNKHYRTPLRALQVF